MALDIRLDFINDIDQECVDKMTELRRRFIELDKNLQEISDSLEIYKKPSGQRTIALSRTNLEISLQFAIKSLCIMGEK